MTPRRRAAPWLPSWQALVVALLVAATVSALGSLATDTGPWYHALDKPPWQPPDRVFGPVWTAIYLITALAAAMAWSHAAERARRVRIVALFALNAVLNLMWTVLFFALRRPDWALVEIAVLWLSIVAVMVVVAPASRAAAALLAPYLAWVSFAVALNLAIVRLNAPFAGA